MGKMCPISCNRTGCVGGGTVIDEDVSKEQSDTEAFEKEGGCADATPQDLMEEWGKSSSCAQVAELCKHSKHGTEVSRLCPQTCGVCLELSLEDNKPPMDEDESSAVGVVVAIIAGVAIVAAGFAGVFYWRSRNR